MMSAVERSVEQKVVAICPHIRSIVYAEPGVVNRLEQSSLEELVNGKFLKTERATEAQTLHACAQKNVPIMAL